jgi:excisionase family DNA binding protein
MTTNQPLTLTVEQAAQVLGIGRSTAYELVRTGDLKHIRLRRRIVVPVAHLAEHLGVAREAVWAALAPSQTSDVSSKGKPAPSCASANRAPEGPAAEVLPLF